MRLVFLNTYEAILKEPFENFLREEGRQTQVFCFQEATETVQALCQKVLPGFVPSFARKVLDERNAFPLATYIRDDILVRETQEIGRAFQDAGLGLRHRLRIGNREIDVANIHGISHTSPGLDTKRDTPGRIIQSQAILDAFESSDCPVIIGGDFNLLPDTESMKLFSQSGYRDLIREYAIPTTRNHIAWDRFPKAEKYFYSDYVFVSPTVEVKGFSVPNIEVSDHLPLILEVK